MGERGCGKGWDRAGGEGGEGHHEVSGNLWEIQGCIILTHFWGTTGKFPRNSENGGVTPGAQHDIDCITANRDLMYDLDQNDSTIHNNDGFTCTIQLYRRMYFGSLIERCTRYRKMHP